MCERNNMSVKELIQAQLGKEGENEGEAEVMNEVFTKLQSEQPKIDQSLKNFLSIIMGKYSSLTIDAKMKNISLSSTSSSSSSSTANTTATTDEPLSTGHTVFTKATINIEHFHQKNLFAFVKLLLNILQETNLPTVSEFTQLYPQGKDELAIDYINKIIQFKGIYFLRLKIMNEKQKISKYFSKSYFLYSNIWPVIKAQLQTRAKTLPDLTLTSEEIDYLIDIYERSIFSSSSSLSSSAALEGEEGNDYNELIWTKNFQQALQEIQKKRQEQIEARKHENNSNDQGDVVQDDHKETFLPI